MYACRVERDSISPAEKRLVSFVITYPRIVLAEFCTHRMNSDTWGDFEVSFCARTTTPDISKNSASSRAIPFAKMVERIKTDPYMPTWSLNQKGMQGKELTDEAVIATADLSWIAARDYLIGVADHLHSLGIHKQDVNRLLEPWGWVTQIVTSSRWDNFFALRCHHAAHPAFRKIARMMFLARKKSVPKKKEFGQWHLPFVPVEIEESFVHYPEIGKDLPDWVKCSAARCAWISYENHDKDGTQEAMLSTYNRLMAEIPKHACYDAATEVLTGSGWKLWSEVNGAETFATLSPDNRIEYQTASRLIDEAHDGLMFRIRSEHVDLMVTPNHNMLASRRQKCGFDNWSLVPVEDFTEASHKVSHGGGLWDSGVNLPMGWGELIGFFIGDGNYPGREGSVSFHLRRKRKIEFLIESAERAGFKVSFGASDTLRLMCPREFRDEFLDECYDKERNKIIPRKVLNMGKDTLCAVLRGLINSDGSVSESGKITYSTTSWDLIGQIQELALKTGGYASSRLNYAERLNSWGTMSKPCYSLCFFRTRRMLSRIGWTQADRSREVSQELYSGRVYCVTVPNGTVYVRRNGKAMWCGNSPVEHQATPFHEIIDDIDREKLRSNLSGWIQARKLIPHEEIKEYRPSEEEISSWGEQG